jgi:hypothetical protein
MPGINIFWVLIAPGVASCFCFFVEMSIEKCHRGFEAAGTSEGSDKTNVVGRPTELLDSLQGALR